MVFADCGNIKIGRSNDPAGRQQTLQTGNPRQLVLAGVLAFDIETQLHRHFKRFHLGGEWFEPSPQLVAELNFLLVARGEQIPE